MHSSTSVSSGLTAARATLVLLAALGAYFLVLEVAMRTVLPRLSAEQGRQAADYRAALLARPTMPDGSKSLLVIGNSLLLQGVDRQRLSRAMGSRFHVLVYPIEGTTYFDWYFGLRRLFAEGARPAAVVLCISVRHVLSDATNGEEFAHFMMRLRDLRAVAGASHLDMTATSAYFFANQSAWLGSRSLVHNGLMEKWLPSAGLLARYLTTQDAPPLTESQETARRAVDRLRAFRILCAAHRAGFVFLTPPSLNPSDPAQTVRASAELAGIAVLMPYRPGEMPRAGFSDGYHLNPTGAALFTDRVAAMLTVTALAQDARTQTHSLAETDALPRTEALH